MNPRSRSFAVASLFAFLSASSLALSAPLRVDLNSVGDRSDVRTPDWENWAVKAGPSDARTFGSVTVTIRPAGSVGAGLAVDWFKLGFDTHATLGSDGVFVKDGDKGGALELVFSGLAPGPHTLVTYHNSLWAKSLSPVRLAITGDSSPAASFTAKPSTRATSDDDLGTGFLAFTATAGRDVVITLKPDGTGALDNAILNGFELDGLDPARRVSHVAPATGEEHTVENPVLTWTPAPAAVTHQLYLGTNADAVTRATPSSPEFRGAVANNTFSTANLSLNHLQNYFWRVDVVDAAKKVTPGEVRRFRVRHLAFPGAEGYGRFAIGGRDGRVIEVTNLDDSGPGSLRAAIDAAGPRTVIFRVGGTITLKSKLVIKNPYITVAGQTAPGDGICVRGATFGCTYTHDIIIRYVRIRVGDVSGETMDGAGFAGCDNCIMDHCSISWSIDEGFSSRGSRNITLQRTLIAEALNMSVHSHYVGTGKGHSFAGSISGDIGSFHHNLLANNAGRNWSLAGGLTGGGHFAGRLDIRNNVVFNWAHRTNDGGVKALNLVGNYYIPGPASRVFHLLQPDFGSPSDPQQYFLEGNQMEGRPQYDADNWANGAVDLRKEELTKTKLTLTEAEKLVRLTQPFAESYVTTQSAHDAYESVIADVGANYPRSDAVDARIIENVRQRTTTFKGSKTGIAGIVDSQADSGGWPELKRGEPPADTDGDGLPDAWEKSHGLNPAVSTDALRADTDGYTALEVYLNSIVAKPASK